MRYQDHPAFKEPAKQDLPRICYILGGEDNPLKVGEHFALDYDCVKNEFIYFIDSKGNVHVDNYSRHLGDDTLCDIINHPEKIIRRPQFSEDEKAVMREFHKYGFDILKRPQGCGIRVENSGGEWFPLPSEMFPQISGKFDAAYLESEDK